MNKRSTGPAEAGATEERGTQPKNRSAAFLHVALSLFIVLALVIALELLSRSFNSNKSGALASLPQATPTITAEIITATPARLLPPTRTPMLARPGSSYPKIPSSTPALKGQDLQPPTSTSEPNQSSLPTATLDPENAWMALPVIPEISDATRAIYHKGLELGNKPNAFSKVGDCNSLSARFLTYFDGIPADAYYNLEAYYYLQRVIDHFSGSFKRQSQAVGDGFNTSAILAPFRADPYICQGGESPLKCEYRLYRPSFAFILVGTDDYLTPDKFEANLREMIETTVDLGIVPILATKADDVNQLNYNPIIAQVAQDYGIPLWNIWLAQQSLPYHGLEDNMHPSGTFAAFDFTESNLNRYGWPVRNLTALQVLDAVWQGVSQ